MIKSQVIVFRHAVYKSILRYNLALNKFFLLISVSNNSILHVSAMHTISAHIHRYIIFLSNREPTAMKRNSSDKKVRVTINIRTAKEILKTKVCEDGQLVK